MPAQRKWLIKGSFTPTDFFYFFKRSYRPISILVRSEQEKYYFTLKTAVNHGTVKRQEGAEVSRFEISSLEGLFFFRSHQLTYKIHIVYTCIDVISSEEDTTKNTKHLT